MTPVTLTLPYPISANRYWRSFVPKGHTRAIVTLSDEAKAYKHQVSWLARKAGVREPITGRVAVNVRLFPQRPLDWERRARRDPLSWDDTVQCIDLDNANKVLFDAMKGVVIEDDRWVRMLSAERMEPDGEARVEVRVMRLTAASPQGSLLEASA
jgi:crossover junction endodeoxyribonuclease RusA